MKDKKESKNILSRILARLLDYSLFYYTANFLFAIFCFDMSERSLIAFLFFLPLFWAPLEALSLSLFGSTPGKALFGISVKDKYGQNLNLATALLRSVNEGWKNLFPINMGNLLYFIQKKGDRSFDKKREIALHVNARKGVRYWVGAIILSASALTFVFEDELSQCSGKKSTFYHSGIATKGWMLFKGPGERFQVQFPKAPQDGQKQYPVPGKPPLKYSEHFYKADNQVQYSVGYATLPKSWLKWSHGLLLKGSAKVIASHLPHTKLTQKRVVTFKKYPGLDFSMQQGKKQIRGRLVLVGSTLYKVEVSYPQELGDSLQGEIAEFVDSFEPTTP